MTEVVIAQLALMRMEFERRLEAVIADQWSGPTPCTEWNVRLLVNHVVGQEFRVARQLQGGTLAEYVATRDDDYLGGDPIGAWQRGRETLDAAIENLESLEMAVDYRTPLTAGRLVGGHAADAAVHTWDLARAIGADEELAPALAAFGLAVCKQLIGDPAMASLFGSPKGPLPEGASDLTQLLHMTGR